MSKVVRKLPDNHWEIPGFKYLENEYDTTCNDCGDIIGVVIPDKIIKWTDDHNGDDQKIMKYLYEDYVFYCPDCQKENGHGQKEKTY